MKFNREITLRFSKYAKIPACFIDLLYDLVSDICDKVNINCFYDLCEVEENECDIILQNSRSDTECECILEFCESWGLTKYFEIYVVDESTNKVISLESRKKKMSIPGLSD